MQAIILRNFQRYLDLTSNQFLNELDKQKNRTDKELNKIRQEHKKHIVEFINELESGYCFGFSVCHGAMDAVGKLKWWEHVLVELNNWDGSEKSLDVPLTLPDSIDNKPVTRRDLFERAINYIAPAQISVPRDFNITGTRQENLLQPVSGVIDVDQSQQHQSHFIMVDDNDQVLTIKKRKFLSGNFTNENLLSVLDEKSIQNNICMIHSGVHAIRIGFDGKNWLVYDPNYSHEKLETIHRTYSVDKKAKMVNEILSRLKTHSISIEVASFDASKALDFPAYEGLKQSLPLSLLEGTGLYYIAMYNPEFLKDLFEQAQQASNPDSLKIKSAIIKSLYTKTEDRKRNTGLMSIVQYAPDLMPELFRFAEGPMGSDFRSSLAKALTETECFNTNGLCRMAFYAPQYIPKLVELANEQNGQSIKLAIGKALVTSRIDGVLTLHIICDRAPESLPALLNLVKTWLHTIALESPDNIVFAIHSVLNSGSETKDRNVRLILQALAEPDADGVTGWQMINRHFSLFSGDKSRLLAHLCTELNKLDVDELKSIGNDLSRALIDDQSQYRGICRERHTFFRSESYGKTSLWQELMTAVQSILKEKVPADDPLMQIKINR